MKISLDTNNFSVKLKPEIFYSDIEYPENTILHISLYSNGFGAETTMDIDIKDFKGFADDINNIYNTLKGEATISEVYGSQMITFKADKTGHIKIIGMLSQNFDGNNQLLKFENSFDQTYLKKFASELNKIEYP